MRFFVGDDNGQLKSVKCSKSLEDQWNIEASTLDDGGMQGKVAAVQRIAVKKEKVTVARADGTISLFCMEPRSDVIQRKQEWKDERFRPEHHYIGLDTTEGGDVISCTSAGHLRLQHPSDNDEEISAETSSDTTFIPNRLCELVVSDDTSRFAYGGDEVEVSLWDTARAFDASRSLLPASAVGSKRRKNTSELIDGEIWRAKNVPNDALNLRQPVHNTALTFLFSDSTNGNSHHLLTGTRIGSVRRYDTRAARRPVADWKDIGKVGGVRKVRQGASEHEVFVADYGSNLFALDLRMGRVLYAYNGIGGAISSLASTSLSSSPSLLASTSLDRYFRLHSAYAPPSKPGGSLERRGEVLCKLWLKSAASCVAWDGVTEPGNIATSQDEDEEDDVWNRIKTIGERGPSGDAVGSEEHSQISKKRKVE